MSFKVKNIKLNINDIEKSQLGKIILFFRWIWNQLRISKIIY
jgi:hypothetical protein